MNLSEDESEDDSENDTGIQDDESEEEEKLEKLPEEELLAIDLYCKANSEPMNYTSDMVSDEEVNELVEQDIPVPSVFHPVFTKFCFSPRQVPEENIPLAIMSMLKDLDIIRRWCIQRRTLAKFILAVRRGYRDNPYHNWKHAFSVTHFAYILIKNLQLISKGVLNHLEVLAFMVSAICHDVDHRGTSNAFQVNCQSTLRTIYSSETSVLEAHHYSQAVRILQTEGCNILANLTSSEFQEFLEIMKTVIMATDIAKHFAIIHDLQDMAVEKSFNPNDSDHHHLAICLMMTACDLSDQTKDWKSATAAAAAVYEEFLAQGDLEKALGIKPMDMMNRDKAVVTDLQVSFVEKVAIPVYRLLSSIFPEAIDAYKGILINRKKWVRLQFLYNTSIEDPEEQAADPTDLQAIINALEFEGAERGY